MTVYERIQEILKDRQRVTFFELGACDGTQTKDISDILAGKDYQYYAFEPDIRRIPDIISRVGNNQRVHIINKAIGAECKEIKFYKSSLNYYGSSSIRKPTDLCFKSWPDMAFEEGVAEVITLDAFCKENGITHIDFIWADIQGAEIDLIAGGHEMLANTGYLYTEYNDGEIYEGCLGQQGILYWLPGWEVVQDYKGDVLLRNTKCVS
jgi:2-O-methyltransferase